MASEWIDVFHRLPWAPFPSTFHHVKTGRPRWRHVVCIRLIEVQGRPVYQVYHQMPSASVTVSLASFTLVKDPWIVATRVSFGVATDAFVLFWERGITGHWRRLSERDPRVQRALEHAQAGAVLEALRA